MSPPYTCNPLHITERGQLDAGCIVVGWSETGGLFGPDAQALRDVMRTGWVMFGGYPRASVPAPEAITSLEDFALVLGDSWALPPELVEHYPQEEKPDAPPGLCF
jgi:hypothetical protein